VTQPISIVVAEDHPVFRKGLMDIIAAEPAFQVVGEAGDGATALALVRRHRPRVVLLDIEMPRQSGLDVAETIRREELGAAIVVLTMYKDAGLFRRALDVGAKGYVLKDSAVTDIAACLHMVAAGRSYISPALSGDLLQRHAELTSESAALAELTPAQRQVLKLIAQGLTTPAIAESLGISPKTVENHRLNICDRLGLHGPQALLRFALERKATLS
jgi:DNA-binding NarL/FixJ family response regulator